MNGRERRLSSLLSTWARLLLHRLLPSLDQFHEGPLSTSFDSTPSQAQLQCGTSLSFFHSFFLSPFLLSPPLQILISPIGDLIGYYRVSTGGNSLITSPPVYNRIQTGFGETATMNIVTDILRIDSRWSSFDSFGVQILRQFVR